MIFGWKQREENNKIARNASRSDILTLTLLSADAKSTVLLRVPSSTKVEERNFSLHFLRWLCLIHGQLAMFPQLVKRLVIFKCQCFCLFDIQQLSVLSKHYFLWNSPPRRDSAECQFIRLNSQFAMSIYTSAFSVCYICIFIYSCLHICMFILWLKKRIKAYVGNYRYTYRYVGKHTEENIK